MKENKKKFKDTAIGKLIGNKLPEAIGVVGEFLPDNGVLGIAKNLIDKSTLTPEEKNEINIGLNDYQLELQKLEVEDRANARWREVEMAKVGGNDFLKILSGIVALSVFVLSVITVLFQDKIGINLNNNPVANQIIGLIGGVALSLFSYYFGTSKSSSDKTKLNSLK